MELLAQVLLKPGGAPGEDVDAVVQRSRSFWADGIPSSLVAASATLALLARGQLAEAEALLAEQPADDVFAVAARAVVALSAGNPGVALTHLRAIYGDVASPRVMVILTVLMAAAEVRLGRKEPAHDRLALLAHQTRPELVRFALRFISDDDLARLARLGVGGPFAEACAVSAGDLHPLSIEMAASLTRVEGELLALVAQGLTYSEIARRRVVSLNTVRTQARSLLRKLDASDREDAVARATRLGLLDGRVSAAGAALPTR